MNFVAKPMSRKDIQDVAELVRKMHNASGLLYFDIMGFLEHTLPMIFPGFTLSVGTKEEMGECHGLTYPDKNEIKLRDDVYSGAMNGNGRDRLTAAHELFHFWLILKKAWHLQGQVQGRFQHTRIQNGKLMLSEENYWFHIS